MPPLVSIPIEERDVLGRDFNVAGTRLGQTPGQEAPQTKALEVGLFVNPFPGPVAAQSSAEIPASGRVFGDGLRRFQSQIEGLGRRRSQQAMGVVERAQQRFLLIPAAQLTHRGCLHQPTIKTVPILEAGRAHPLRRRHHILGGVGERHVERTELTAQESGRSEGLEFLALADIQTLTNIDEGRHCGVLRPQCARHHTSDVRAGDRLRRGVSRVPVELMPRMENETQIAGRVSPDEGAAIHHLGHLLQSLADPNAIHGRRNGREGREDRVGVHALFVGRKTLGIEGLGGGHAAAHPQHDDRVGRGRGPQGLAFGAHQGPRISGTQSSQRGGAESFDEIAATEIGSLHEKGVWR